MGPDVLGPAEAARLLKVSRQRLHTLRASDPLFPKPRELASGQVWDGPELRAYAKERRLDRSQPRTRLLREYRRLGSCYAAARAQNVPYATARRWLNEAGVKLS